MGRSRRAERGIQTQEHSLGHPRLWPECPTSRGKIWWPEQRELWALRAEAAGAPAAGEPGPLLPPRGWMGKHRWRACGAAHLPNTPADEQGGAKCQANSKGLCGQ